jgi:hypothetical protein
MDESSIDLSSLTANAARQAGQETPRGDGLEAFNFEPTQESSSEARLPPPDGGKDAWLFLAACFTLEALIWGFPFTYGIFQDHYSKHPPFAGDPNVAVIGTCAMVSTGVSTSEHVYQTCPSYSHAHQQHEQVCLQRPLINSSI